MIFLIIIGVGAVIALIKEMCSMIARGIIRLVHNIIIWIFSIIGGLASFIIKIIASPFLILWGFVKSR